MGFWGGEEGMAFFFFFQFEFTCVCFCLGEVCKTILYFVVASFVNI